MEYSLVKATGPEADEVFSLIKRRIDWLRENIADHPWVTIDYLGLFPLSYYREQQEQGNLYIFKSGNDDLVGAAVLLYTDDRWPEYLNDLTTYLYIHNFVTDPEFKGAGKRFIKEIENKALQENRSRVCLDCACDNRFLNEYYESQGYQLNGRCQVRDYTGNRREKIIA